MKKSITIFTANVNDNNDLQSSLHTFCIKSWERLVVAFKKINIDCKITIFDFNSPEMKEFNSLKDWNFKRPSMKANAFRLWILSKYPNHLWLDWDIYIPEKFNINQFDLNQIFLYKIFCVMYNANNLNLFSKIFNAYLTDDFCQNNYDQAVFKYLNLKEHCTFNWRNIFMHLAKIDTDRIKPIVWVTSESFKGDINYYINSIDKYVYFSSNSFSKISGYNHIIFNCLGDKDLITFVNNLKTNQEKGNAYE